MLFRILTAWPAPASPQCVTSLARWRSSGSMRVKVSLVPPTMIDRVPSIAACRVRAIGASAKAQVRPSNSA